MGVVNLSPRWRPRRRRARVAEKALADGADFPDLFNELGDLSLHRSDTASAVRYHQESMAREARDETRIHLAHAMIETADFLGARKYFNEAQLSSESTLGLAYCSYMRGESSAAQRAWQSVITEMPNAPPEDREYAQRWLDVVLDRESKERWQDEIRWDRNRQGLGSGRALRRSALRRARPLSNSVAPSVQAPRRITGPISSVRSNVACCIDWRWRSSWARPTKASSRLAWSSGPVRSSRNPGHVPP